MSKLPPLELEEDNKLGAYNETTKVAFRGCKHESIYFDRENHELRCKCGVSYTGPRLGELYNALHDRV